ncbi:MAG TPA: hypothetical protein VMF58_07470 [Rhizomicrobium sp.]|nr:hypothetical protein [Rhizomicrobium sp.]
MTRPTDAIVTGFTKNGELCRRAFAPLLELRQQNIIRDIHYVTWDSAALDGFVAPVLDLGVSITRVPQPEAEGNPNQRGIVYQTHNLDAALARIADPATLLVKLRPDFLFRGDFLKAKLHSFETECAIPAETSFEGIKMPRSPFSKKVWIPWADANQPFFYEDAAYIGVKRDLEKLVPQNPAAPRAPLADMDCGSLVHVLRYIDAFLPRYPIFRRYVDNYGAFINDLSYRKGFVGMLLADGFFWHMLAAHAWILHTSFRIDCGTQDDLRFYPNTVNTDWSDFGALRLTAPYDHVEMWRGNTNAGHAVMPAVMRVYGRLMDDAWPRSLFTARMADMPDGMLARLLRGVALYDTGCLKQIEDAFYEKLRAFREQHWVRKRAA